MSTTYGPPVETGEMRIADDTDPSILYWQPANYTDGWQLVTNQIAYNQTLHETKCIICTASLLFNGTGITLTSLLSPNGAKFYAILDGTASGPYELSNYEEKVGVVYAVEGLSSTSRHNITFIKASTDGQDTSVFNIDSLTIIDRPPTSSGSSASPTATGRTTVTQPGGSSQTSAAPVPQAQASSPPPIGAIVGGTIGGVAALIVVVVWFILVRRNKAQRARPARRY
ncbi:hypothetical protein PIIN_01288 [Serendipita indica DSM 11827]|uniref:Uncharacterized protein n=1 Tax=Serendipita indica (strain DSM 11827) TaxID=1109443 RepID=G4T800_SERID|nr:hypothetical protein PIIN_01288 [Serendipita indica DSM 11827]